MMGTLQELFGHDRQQSLLDGLWRLAGGKAGSVGHPEDVGVDRDGWMAERRVQHDIGGLASDAGQRFQRFSALRNFSVMAFHQQSRQLMDIPGLGVEETKGADVVANCGLAERYHRCGGGGIGKKPFGRLVHADIGRLRGQHDGDQQGERVGVIQLGRGFGQGGGKTGHHLGGFWL